MTATGSLLRSHGFVISFTSWPQDGQPEPDDGLCPQCGAYFRCEHRPSLEEQGFQHVARDAPSCRATFGEQLSEEEQRWREEDARAHGELPPEGAGFELWPTTGGFYRNSSGWFAQTPTWVKLSADVPVTQEIWGDWQWALQRMKAMRQRRPARRTLRHRQRLAATLRH